MQRIHKHLRITTAPYHPEETSAPWYTKTLLRSDTTDQDYRQPGEQKEPSESTVFVTAKPIKRKRTINKCMS